MKHNQTPAMFDPDQDTLLDVPMAQPTYYGQMLTRDQSELVQLCDRLKEEGYPTKGDNACKLWELLSSHRSPFGMSETAEIYRNLGYKPFSGYPLQRD